MNFAEQEQFVAKLASTMATAHEGAGNVEVRSGATNLISGASGFRHQIDVSVRTTRDLTLYECKYWGGRVDPEAILAFAARGMDIQQAHLGTAVVLNMVVSTDLTSGARTLADYFGIRLNMAKSAAEFAVHYKTDWQAGSVDEAKVTDTADARLGHTP